MRTRRFYAVKLEHEPRRLTKEERRENIEKKWASA